MKAHRAAAAAVVLLAGVALSGCGKRPPSGRAASFRLDDATVALEASPAKLLRSKAFKGFLEEIRKIPDSAATGPLKAIPGAGEIEIRLGVDPSNVESLHVSLERGRETKMLIAAVLGAPLDRDRFLAGMSEGAGEKYRKLGSHAGVDLYGIGAEKRSTIAFPNARLVAGGSTRELKKGLADHAAGRSGRYSAGLRRALGEAPGGAMLVLAAVMTPETAKELASRGLPVDATLVEAVTVALEAGEALDLTVQLRMKDRAEAERTRTAAVGVVAQGKAMAELTGLKALGDLVASVKVGGSGRTVEITASVRPGVVTAAAAVVPLVKGMLPGGAGAGAGGKGEAPALPRPGPRRR